MGPTRVFVSSPRLGLEEERAAVKAALERMRGTEFAGMEVFGSRNEDANTASLEEVGEAQLYVGIVGGRYGSGITRAEYDRARERNLDCLLYLQKEDSIRIRDTDPAAQRAYKQWVTAITDSFHGHVVTAFSSADELAMMVAADVHNWLFRKLVREAKDAALAGAVKALRALLAQTHNTSALRAALMEAGIAAGDDLLDSLLALAPGFVKELVEGIRDLPTDYAARIENFLNEYVGTPEEPVPFGGRADVFEELDNWLERDATHPYLLIAAGAGRGKTATLVHWARRYTSDSSVHFVFVPASIRFRTNLAGVFFPALAARLARAHGDRVPTDVNLAAEVWRGMVADYLRKPQADGRTLVVVLDGLDEAADWEAGPDLLPRRPASGVRIVVSARLTADLPSNEAWLGQLGWDSPYARSLDLRSLTRQGVRDVMASMGCPLADLDGSVVDELHRLSGGDPLLIRLYVDELWSRGEAATRLQAADLATVDPGLEGFFERWWREQKKLWGNASPLKERGVRAVLNLLAMAFGPLRREDILALAPAEADLTSWTLDDAVGPLRRFLIEGQPGIVFSHPRFGQFLANELTAAERRSLDEHFAAWSRTIRTSMREGALSQADAPPYVVLYSGAHLERLDASAAVLCDLLTPEWRTAWEATEGTLSGFSTDVSRVWRAARREDERVVAAGASPSQLPTEALCFLLQARIRSMAQAIPSALFGRLVQEALWSPRQAAAYARNMRQSPERVAALVEVSRFAEASERAALEEESYAMVAQMADSGVKTSASVHLLRTGAPLDVLSSATLEEEDWVTAALALAETGRASEIIKLKCRLFFRNVSDLINELLDRNAVPEAEIVFRDHKENLMLEDANLLFWRFALHGVSVLSPAWPNTSRIHALFEQTKQAALLTLNGDDIGWVATFFREVKIPSRDLADFASAVAIGLDDGLTEQLRSQVSDPVDCAHLFADDSAQTLLRLRREFDSETRSVHDEYQWLRRIARIADGEIVRRGILFMASEYYFDVTATRNLLALYLRRDAGAFRDALAEIPLSARGAGRIYAIAVELDAGYHQSHLQNFVTALRNDYTWRREYGRAVQSADKSTLLTMAGLFRHFGDRSWLNAIHLIFAPSPAALRRAAADWRSSTTGWEALISAAVVPDEMETILRAFIEAAPEDKYWPSALDAEVELLPTESAAELRRSLWSYVGNDLPNYFRELPGMVTVPNTASITGWLERLRLIQTEDKYDAKDKAISEILLLGGAERADAIARLEREYTVDLLASPHLRHIANELSSGMIDAIAGHLILPDSKPGTLTVLAFAPRFTQPQALALHNHALGLPAKERAEIFAGLINRLPQPDRSQALDWLFSPEVIPHAAEFLLEAAIVCPEARSDLVKAASRANLVGAMRAMSTAGDEWFVVAVAACRILEFDAATARELALAAISSSETSAEAAWGVVALVRLLLLRSGDQHLFAGLLAAAELAVSIFP